MKFDPINDEIAISIPEFTLKKKTDGLFGKYSEPYIVSLAIDGQGLNNPKLDFNHMPFPKVAVGRTVKMLGDGHLLYGPRNPGKFVALSVLFMESDGDISKLGETIEGIVKTSAIKLGIATIATVNPGSSVILGIVKELTQLVAGQLKKNRDDELFRTEGTFLRDHQVPYHVNRLYTGLGNDYVDFSMKIIPLSITNGQGSEIKSISL